jgi:hypothetical protein
MPVLPGNSAIGDDVLSPKMQGQRSLLVVVQALRKRASGGQSQARPFAALQGLVMLTKVKPIRSERYRRWVASLPCIACGIVGHGHQGLRHANVSAVLRAAWASVMPCAFRSVRGHGQATAEGTHRAVRKAHAGDGE